MRLYLNIKYDKTTFTQDQQTLTKEIFGIPPNNVYFKLNINIPLGNDKTINFNGISGTGKTIIKDYIKDKLIANKEEVLDFDDIEKVIEENSDKTIMELLNIKSNTDPILQLINGFGLFEMRLLFLPIERLSQGQKKRVAYTYLLNSGAKNILIDEFLTFVDDLSSIAFAQNIFKFIEGKNIRLFTFGVNTHIINQFEDVTYVLGNSCINAEIRQGYVKYV